jgi:hypothetical protein
VTYWVPAVLGASVGPERVTVSGSLSAFTYFVTEPDRYAPAE